ncbi:MAG TPA: response regulator transcription factor, partial [Bacillota bacterium]|nr:response regulator transcription factor [Bacillota bacterium]
MIKVLIVDHQLIFRESLKIVIERDQEIQVIGSCGDGREAYEFCGRQMPDIVLMDITMPKCDGIEGTRLIKRKYPDTKILILTIFNEDTRVAEALRYGADGYVLKDISPDNFILAIKSVAQGLVVIQKQVMNKITTQLEGTTTLEYVK